jgi:hypothetical protein
MGHWLLFGLALLFANLPFVSNRIMGTVPVTKKSGWTRVLEVIAGYFIVGLIGFTIESSLGQANPQRWEFFALTACLFLVFAFPGFVYRFLWRSPKT